jgi:hypothetical protein
MARMRIHIEVSPSHQRDEYHKTAESTGLGEPVEKRMEKDIENRSAIRMY